MSANTFIKQMSDAYEDFPSQTATGLRVTTLDVGTVNTLVLTPSGSLVLQEEVPVIQSQGAFADAGITVNVESADVGQATNITTAVPIGNFAGTFNTQASTLGAGLEQSFTMTNAGISENDICIISAKYNGSGGSPRVGITDVASGAFTVTITNEHASAALDGDFDINYYIIKMSVA